MGQCCYGRRFTNAGLADVGVGSRPVALVTDGLSNQCFYLSSWLRDGGRVVRYALIYGCHGELRLANWGLGGGLALQLGSQLGKVVLNGLHHGVHVFPPRQWVSRRSERLGRV